MQAKQLHISKSGAVEVQFVRSEALERLDELALEALGISRKELSVAMRFLNPALWHLEFERAPLMTALSTGGRFVRYDPENAVARFREQSADLSRDMLHATLHCAFHHPYEKGREDYEAWSLACDISAEACAMELVGERFACAGDAERARVGRQLAAIAGTLTAPALYRVLRRGQAGERLYEAQGISAADLAGWRELFKRDGHEMWASHPHEPSSGQREEGAAARVPDLQAAEGADALDGAGNASAPGSAAAGAAGEPEAAVEPKTAADSETAAGQETAAELEAPAELDAAEESESASDLASDEAEGLLEEWRRISGQVEAQLKAMRTQAAAGDGSMLKALSVANRKPADYDAFLRKFATFAEDVRVSDEEFDYVFYTYGLSRYGNMPLVEPLEYAESNRVREFVIALDTSGSCSARLIQVFVERTYDLLRRQTSFGDKINIHLVQCDKQVRSSTKVTSLRQLEGYADSFWVSGGGGTDFRPVFDYVDSLVEAGEFQDLRGLVYFTDGHGTFPARAPAYDVAFAFVSEEGLDVRVPPWAMKVVMTPDEVLDAGRRCSIGQPDRALARRVGKGASGR